MLPGSLTACIGMSSWLWHIEGGDCVMMSVSGAKGPIIKMIQNGELKVKGTWKKSLDSKNQWLKLKLTHFFFGVQDRKNRSQVMTLDDLGTFTNWQTHLWHKNSNSQIYRPKLDVDGPECLVRRGGQVPMQYLRLRVWQNSCASWMPLVQRFAAKGSNFLKDFVCFCSLLWRVIGLVDWW